MTPCRSCGSSKKTIGPELPEAYRDWLASEISKQMGVLDLESNVRWEGPTLWEPRALPFLQAIEQERTARMETAQRTPFDGVLKKLKGSMNRLKVLCEGTTDRPVFSFLAGQFPSCL